MPFLKAASLLQFHLFDDILPSNGLKWLGSFSDHKVTTPLPHLYHIMTIAYNNGLVIMRIPISGASFNLNKLYFCCYMACSKSPSPYYYFQVNNVITKGISYKWFLDILFLLGWMACNEQKFIFIQSATSPNSSWPVFRFFETIFGRKMLSLWQTTEGSG